MPIQPVPVFVLHDGRWLPGTLLHRYRARDGSWRGVVTYSAGIGERYLQARSFAELRPAQ